MELPPFDSTDIDEELLFSPTDTEEEPPFSPVDMKEERPTGEGSNLLTEDAFSSERSQKLFEAIDELQSCGANRDIELPELVIVGDQSAGKSSLLQSLTDIPFPVAGRLCTRFPTRIVSRRTPGGSDATRISIEASHYGPFSHAPIEERQQKYAKFSQNSSKFTAAEFLEVVDKATRLMGITHSPSDELVPEALHRNDAGRHFSSDILRIEISGPNRSYFSILDLPGVFHSVTKNLTEKEKDGVRKLVSKHMIPDQSVVVCVASGTNDLANQAIFDMASKYDPNGERTVGVITKCDATQHPNQVLELAQNQEKHFHHGWFVVRNRTPSEVEANIEAHDRDQREEEFFEKLPWNTLPQSRRGVQALRKYLTDLLCARIQMGFPMMLQTLKARRISVASQLQALGEPRDSIERKRAYLSSVAQSFHSQAFAALHGRYGDIKTEDIKLRKAIRDANDLFMEDIKSNGHLVPFAEIASVVEMKKENTIARNGFRSADARANSALGTPVTETNGILEDFEESASSETEELRPVKAPSYNQRTAGLLTPDPSPYRRKSASQRSSRRSSTPSKANGSTREELESPVAEQLSEHVSPADTNDPGKSSEQIYSWIRQEVEASRGTELQGTLNPEVLALLFHKQASKWRYIAEAHFTSVADFTSNMLARILETKCDITTRNKIWPIIFRAGESTLKEKFDLLNEHVDDLTSRHLQTNNSAFLENVARARHLRFEAALLRYQHANKSQNGLKRNSNQIIIDIQDVSTLFSELHMSNSRNLDNEIHDTLKAYYDIARDEFVEFVTQLVVEKFVSSPRGPVLLFQPQYVAELSDEKIIDLATEDEAVIREREEKEATLGRLWRAESIALKYS